MKGERCKIMAEEREIPETIGQRKGRELKRSTDVLDNLFPKNLCIL